MKKSLNINARRAGRKVTKSVGFVNPDASNAVVDEFAKMFNNLSNDSYVNAEVVKKMDTTEQETVPEGGGSTSGKKSRNLTFINNSIEYDGNDNPTIYHIINDGSSHLRTVAYGEHVDYSEFGQFFFTPETDEFAAAVLFVRARTSDTPISTDPVQ